MAGNTTEASAVECRMPNEPQETFTWDDVRDIAYAIAAVANANISEKRVAQMVEPMLAQLNHIATSLINESHEGGSLCP